MSFGAQSSADKVMVVVPPIAAFVAAGFEHSVANLYFLPYALAIKTWGGPEFWAAINQTAASYPELTVGSAFHNILVATVGNLVGGSLMVGRFIGSFICVEEPDQRYSLMTEASLLRPYGLAPAFT